MALGGGEGKPCLQGTLEEPLLRCDQVHQLSVEKREPRELGQFGKRRGAEGDDRFFQDGGHRGLRGGPGLWPLRRPLPRPLRCAPLGPQPTP